MAAAVLQAKAGRWSHRPGSCTAPGSCVRDLTVPRLAAAGTPASASALRSTAPSPPSSAALAGCLRFAPLLFFAAPPLPAARLAPPPEGLLRFAGGAFGASSSSLSLSSSSWRDFLPARQRPIWFRESQGFTACCAGACRQRSAWQPTFACHHSNIALRIGAVAPAII